MPYRISSTNQQHTFIDLRSVSNSCFQQDGSTGKEKDTETGYGYFGARYMDHELMTMWLSVDPMADKYPSMSPYAYCAWNPVKLIDPDGRDTINLADSKFLRAQPDISNALIINGHGKSRPPIIKNDNIDYDDDLPILSSHDASTVASYISKTNVYQENSNDNTVTPVFLISCQTGETNIPYISFADGLGQALPNALVIAPVGDVHAKKSFMWLKPKEGESYNCYWRVLYNGHDIGHIENYEAFNISTLLSSTQKTVNAYNASHHDNQIKLPNLNLQ